MREGQYDVYKHRRNASRLMTVRRSHITRLMYRPGGQICIERRILFIADVTATRLTVISVVLLTCNTAVLASIADKYPWKAYEKAADNPLLTMRKNQQPVSGLQLNEPWYPMPKPPVPAGLGIQVQSTLSKPKGRKYILNGMYYRPNVTN